MNTKVNRYNPESVALAELRKAESRWINIKPDQPDHEIKQAWRRMQSAKKNLNMIRTGKK
jgi:hypothetical protein